MRMNYKDLHLGERPENPKTAGSRITPCRPQTGPCPNGCTDCFYKGGRYYEDIDIPHIPDPDWVRENDLIVRMNDGHDSSHGFEEVLKTAKMYSNVFFNTQHPHRLSEFPGPVVLTINGQYTDHAVWMVSDTRNLMAVRFRLNTWNIDLARLAHNYYLPRDIPTLYTFMAYYREYDAIPEEHKKNYIWKKRTVNSYWCISGRARTALEELLIPHSSYTLACTSRTSHACKDCRNCERLYKMWKDKR
jgi:hypothetical protein